MAVKRKRPHGGCRPGAGRKPLVSGQPLERILMVRFSAADYAALEQAAGDQSLGAFVREAVRRALRRESS